jgi:putative flavoprotein involved in K+ transport
MPGLALDGDPDREPTRDEVIDYLGRYAKELELPVQLRTPVTALADRDGGFVAESPAGTIEADQVIVATGPFQTARIPEFAASVAADVHQTHSTGYRRPDEIPPGRVVVVGGGNTGYQIAEELAADHHVVLAVGSRQTPFPLRFLGRQIFWWGTKLGVLSVTAESRIGARLSRRETLIGSSPRTAKRLGIELRPRAVSASGRTVRFADGTESDADAIIWATGYEPDYSWITVPVVEAGGRVRHRRGVTDRAGLYFVGLTWQHTRGSALLGFVADDAAYISEQVAARARAKQAA